MYRTYQEQMNDAFAFGIAIFFVGLMFGMVRSLVSASLRPESEVPEILPQTTKPEGYTVLPQVKIEGGQPVPTEYLYLTGWLREPLPEYSLLALPTVIPEAGERKIDAVLKQLKDGIESIQDSDKFRLFLSTMAKFHDYSIGNLILIAIQKPDATHVAGFNT